MPRPRKWRRVCGLPDSCRFGPLDMPAGESDAVVMTIDEYETIRLIDLEALNQEACASRMNIARTTVQGIYVEARRKLAEALVLGRVLSIDGGDYRLCGSSDDYCGQRGCRRHACEERMDQKDERETT